MNEQALLKAQKAFLEKYPGGFSHPAMQELAKKHKMDKIVEFAKTSFSHENFSKPNEIIENMIKIVGKSSMVSLFEKPKFRDFANALGAADRKRMSAGLEKFLHSDSQNGRQDGFNMMLQTLVSGKLGKWPLISVFGAYYKPDKEVFMKPTTVKGVIQTFGLKNLEYKPQPSWEFYMEYCKQINAMKKIADKSLSPSNAAFSGFLMMVMNGL